MLIRTGILCVPQFDDEACQIVNSILRRTGQMVTMMQEIGVGDQRHWIEERLRQWCDEEELDLVLTIGGTMPAPGPSSKQSVPQATLSVIERTMPGLAELMRSQAHQTTPLAMLDRSIVGIRGRTLIVNLPAGAPAAALFLEAIVDLIEPVIAHLQEQPDAPQIADSLEIGDEKPQAALRAEATRGRKQLNAEEFAAFLRRSTENKVGDESI